MSASAPTFDALGQRSRLSAMATGELRQLYRELSGDDARCRNRECLARRVTWSSIPAVASISTSASLENLSTFAHMRSLTRGWLTPSRRAADAWVSLRDRAMRISSAMSRARSCRLADSSGAKPRSAKMLPFALVVRCRGGFVAARSVIGVLRAVEAACRLAHIALYGLILAMVLMPRASRATSRS